MVQGLVIIPFIRKKTALVIEADLKVRLTSISSPDEKSVSRPGLSDIFFPKGIEYRTIDPNTTAFYIPILCTKN